MVRMESKMSSTLGVRSVVASAFCILDQYTSERFGRLRSTRGEGASGVSPRSPGVAMVRMESRMSSTLSVRSVVASAFCVLDQYASERFGRLRSTHG
jgi:hypothetical protein